MDAIQREWVDAYADSINGLQADVSARLKRLLYALDPHSPTLLDDVFEIMNSVCGWSTALAESMSCTFYDGIRDMQGIKSDYLAEPKNTRVPSATYTAVAGIMKDGLTELAVTQLSNRVAYETKRAASENIIANAIADKREPKWARVPSPDCKCDFCLMLGSRGFAYASAKSAGDDMLHGTNADHYHAFCKCEIVPSWDKNPVVDGYNPRALYNEWQSMIEDKAAQRAERNGTTVAEERANIMQSYADASIRARARRNSK